jgi:hypothetical protein
MKMDDMPRSQKKINNPIRGKKLWKISARVWRFIINSLLSGIRIADEARLRADSRLIYGKKVKRTLVCGTISLSERMPANAERPLPYIHSKSALNILLSLSKNVWQTDSRPTARHSSKLPKGAAIKQTHSLFYGFFSCHQFSYRSVMI